MSRATGYLAGAARGLALLLSIFLAVALPVSLVGHNLGRLLFSPERMAELVVSRLAENPDLRREILRQFFRQTGSQSGEAFNMAQASEHLDPPELDAIAEVLFPPGWLEQQLSSLLEQLYAWPDQDELDLTLTLDFRPVSAWLGRGRVHSLIETLVDSWPACSVEQVELMIAEAAASGEVVVRYCEPPEPFRSVLVDAATFTLMAQVKAIPPLVQVGGGRPSNVAAEDIMATKEQLRLIRVFLIHGWLLPLSLLGVIMALAVRSSRELCLWWGMPLLVGGLLGFALVVLGEGAVRQGVLGLAQSLPSEVHARLVTGLAEGVIFEMRRGLFGQALGVAVAGFGLLVSWVWLGRPRQALELGRVPPSAIAR